MSGRTRRPVFLAAVVAVAALVAVAAGAAAVARRPSRSSRRAAGSAVTTSAPAAPATTSAPAEVAPPTTVDPAATDPVAAVNTAAAAKALPAVPLPTEPVAGADAAAIAAQLAAAWAAVHDPSTPAGEVARQSHVQQVAIRRLAAAPDLRAPTLARLPTDARAATATDIDAAAKLRSLVGAPRTALPAWRILAPPPAAELLADYRAAEKEIGVPWQYLAAIHLVETRFGRIRGASEAGARGPMQFLPATFAVYGNGGDIENPRDAIFAAARLLKANGAAGSGADEASIRRAVFRYNHDNRYVDAVVDYANRMRADESALRGYYGWQVYYVTTAGDVWLPVGYQAG